MKRLFFLLLVSLLCVHIGYAADNTQNTGTFFNREEYRKASKGFKYEVPQLSKKIDVQKRKNWDWPKYLSYILVIAALVFLIYKLIAYIYSPNNIIVKNSQFIPNQPEDEPTIESNLDELLELAIKQKDYKEALRIYYLLSIKNLNDNKIITYTIDKTNYEYVSEVGGHPVFPIFRELTIIFERIWFGDSSLDESYLNSYRTKYLDLNAVISSNRKKSTSV